MSRFKICILSDSLGRVYKNLTNLFEILEIVVFTRSKCILEIYISIIFCIGNQILGILGYPRNKK